MPARERDLTRTPADCLLRHRSSTSRDERKDAKTIADIDGGLCCGGGGCDTGGGAGDGLLHQGLRFRRCRRLQLLVARAMSGDRLRARCDLRLESFFRRKAELPKAELSKPELPTNHNRLSRRKF
jgi:hypothetical protein